MVLALCELELEELELVEPEVAEDFSEEVVLAPAEVPDPSEELLSEDVFLELVPDCVAETSSVVAIFSPTSPSWVVFSLEEVFASCEVAVLALLSCAWWWD